MTNANIMEEVMCLAHQEGIIKELHKRAEEYRTSEKRIDLYESYIRAYEDLKKERV